jgi:hypothetical protein
LPIILFGKYYYVIVFGAAAAGANDGYAAGCALLSVGLASPIGTKVQSYLSLNALKLGM